MYGFLDKYRNYFGGQGGGLQQFPQQNGVFNPLQQLYQQDGLFRNGQIDPLRKKQSVAGQPIQQPGLFPGEYTNSQIWSPGNPQQPPGQRQVAPGFGGLPDRLFAGLPPNMATLPYIRGPSGSQNPPPGYNSGGNPGYHGPGMGVMGGPPTGPWAKYTKDNPFGG